jgi:MYXO-CTERM domain-containing protein
MSLICSMVAFAAASAVAGPVFDEPPGGDAGTTREDAKDVKASNGGSVGVITGSLTGSSGLMGGYGDYQDVYRIYIEDPMQFRAETAYLGGGEALRDPMLFLFNEAGQGIIANNDVDDGVLGSKIHNDAGNGEYFFTEPGIYYLAITSALSEATAEVGGDPLALFEMGLPSNQTGIIQPRETWSQYSWTAWTTPSDFSNFGTYEIMLNGVGSVPGPAGMAVLGLAAIGRRRRR